MAVSAIFGYEENIITGIFLVKMDDFNFLQMSSPSMPERNTSSRINCGLYVLTASQALRQSEKANTSNPFFLRRDFTTVRRSKSSSRIRIFCILIRQQKACNDSRILSVKRKMLKEQREIFIFLLDSATEKDFKATGKVYSLKVLVQIIFHLFLHSFKKSQ